MAFDYINEAFKKLDLLEEQMFDTSLNGVNELSNFMDNDDAQDIVKVIDPEAETEEDLENSYVGKVIINCNVCHSHIFENKDDIEISEDGQVNVESVCPYCGEQEGFIIVGEIAPYNDKPNEDPEVEDTAETTEPAEDTDDVQEITESKHTDDVNMPRLGSKATRRMAAKESELTEDFKEVSIKTEDQKLEMTSDENGKVTVTTEPIENESIESEMIVPVSDETESDILANNNVEEPAEEPAEEEPAEEDAAEETEDSETELDFDEVDEEGLDELGESYLHRVYENVESFKTTSVSANDTTLIVEGLIKFTSGAEKKTGFIFEAKDVNARGQLRFCGHNKHLTESKDAFSLVGRIDNKKLFVESLKYNYKVNDNSVRGVIRRK